MLKTIGVGCAAALAASTEEVVFGIVITATLTPNQIAQDFRKQIIAPWTFCPSPKPVSARPRRNSARTST